MKYPRLLKLFVTTLMLLSLVACGATPPPSTPPTSGAISTATDDEDYRFFVDNFGAITDDVGAYYDNYDDFYGLLLEMQARGDIPYEDKLVAEGDVTVPFSVEIDGKVFSNAEAEALTVYTASYRLFTKVEGHDAVWVGYRFTDVCDALGIELPESIRLNAEDGFSQSFDTKNIDDNTMLALSRDGNSDDAPYFAPCSMLINANYTKYLAAIELA